MVSSAILATWVCSLIHWAGVWRFVRELGLLTALLVPPLLVRIHAEEKLLHTQFGAEYDAYLPRPHVVTDSRNLLVDPCIPLKSSMQSETHSGFAAMYR